MEVEPGIDTDMSVNREPAAPQSGVIPTHLAEERQRRAGGLREKQRHSAPDMPATEKGKGRGSLDRDLTRHLEEVKATDARVAQDQDAK
jgi:hypothetical protein